VPDSDYWKAPPERRVAVNARLPRSLKLHLDAVQQLWRTMAELDGSDPDTVTTTYVIERLLTVGVDGVWAQVGQLAGLQGMPRNPEEWERLRKALAKNKSKR
jgi:hypothetical protein